MNTLFNLIVVAQVVSALAIIALVLMQHGKGADMGAAFGSGASGSLFGATGSSNFMSKSTAVAAAIFFAATLGLSLLANQRSTAVDGGVMSNVKAPAPVTGSAAIPSANPVPAPAAAVPAPAPVEAAPAAPASGAPAQQIPK